MVPVTLFIEVHYVWFSISYEVNMHESAYLKFMEEGVHAITSFIRGELKLQVPVTIVDVCVIDPQAEVDYLKTLHTL